MRLKSRRALFVMAAAVGSLLAAELLWRRCGPTLVLNLTGSIPRGLYAVQPPKALRRGMLVMFPLPARVKEELGSRPWLLCSRPLIKPVAALPGDLYCIRTGKIFLQRLRPLPVFRSDLQGLPLPRRRGCKRVKPGNFLPLSGYSARSFDGRYFGQVPASVIVGEAKAVITC
jgi:conjugative transfer signal peptidase TraF